MTRCFLGLGSNLNNPRRQLHAALQRIRSLPRTTLKKISPIYLTIPWGVRYQPRYYNLVVEIDTTLLPVHLLRHCQKIEHKQHRLRKRHFGPRTLDIDLLIYGDRKIHTPILQIPHPLMKQRAFVLEPLFAIAPDITNAFFSVEIGLY